MFAAAVAVLCVGAFALGAGRSWRSMSRIDRLEARVRHYLLGSTREPRYRALGAGELEPERAVLDEPTRELHALQMTVLGDVVNDNVDFNHATRWFVDDAGTTFGLVARYNDTVAVLMLSLDDAHYFQTRMSTGKLSVPPSVVRQEVPAGTSFAVMLAKHRELIAGAAQLKSVADLEGALRELLGMRAASLAWRDAQPPVELLRGDLRLILGPNNERLVALLARRLQAPLPRARVMARPAERSTSLDHL